MDNSNQNVKENISYLKNVMSRSEISYRIFSSFFFIMVIYYLFLMPILSAIIGYIIRDMFPNDFSTRDIVLLYNIADIITQTVCTLPVVFILAFFGRKVKTDNMGMSVWLFSIISFITVFGIIILPIVSITTNQLYALTEISDIFMLMCTALIIFITAAFTNSKKLKIYAILYLSLSAVILTAIGITITYIEIDIENISRLNFKIGDLYTIFAYIKFFIYSIMPSAGYFILALFMKKRNKEKSSL